MPLPSPPHRLSGDVSWPPSMTSFDDCILLLSSRSADFRAEISCARVITSSVSSPFEKAGRSRGYILILILQCCHHPSIPFLPIDIWWCSVVLIYVICKFSVRSYSPGVIFAQSFVVRGFTAPLPRLVPVHRLLRHLIWGDVRFLPSPNYVQPFSIPLSPWDQSMRRGRSICPENKKRREGGASDYITISATGACYTSPVLCLRVI